MVLPDLMVPLAAHERERAEGDPRHAFEWKGPIYGAPRSYPPSDGGAPRLVMAARSSQPSLGVWDTGTGAFLRALEWPQRRDYDTRFFTYQRPSDGRPRIAAVGRAGQLGIWDGDDFQMLYTLQAGSEGVPVGCLAVYEEPTSGRTRLVTG
jgi:hypothetical protein